MSYFYDIMWKTLFGQTGYKW